MKLTLRPRPLEQEPASQGIGCNTISVDDAANLLKFLKTLREVFGTHRLITADVWPGGIIGPDGNVLSSFAAYGKYLDYANLMTVSFV